MPLTAGLGFEGELLDGGVFQDGESFNTFLGLAHLYTQNQAYALGVFGGAGSSTFASFWQGGVEGQAYLGNLTAEATVGYTSIHSGDATFWNTRFGGKYYFTPNDKLSLFGNYLAAAVRNPSAAQGQFGNLIFGFAVTEALGIFSLLIALLLLFVPL